MSDKPSILDQFAAVIERVSVENPDSIDGILDLTPQHKEVVVLPPRDDGDDYKTAREGIHRALGSAETALSDLLRIASLSQHPRAYEVVNQILNTIIDGNKDLLEIKKKSQEIDGPKSDAPTNVTTHNTLVVTSAQMLDMIREKTRMVGK